VSFLPLLKVWVGTVIAGEKAVGDSGLSIPPQSFLPIWG